MPENIRTMAVDLRYLEILKQSYLDIPGPLTDFYGTKPKLIILLYLED